LLTKIGYFGYPALRPRSVNFRQHFRNLSRETVPLMFALRCNKLILLQLFHCRCRRYGTADEKLSPVPLIPAINHRRFRCYWRLIIACPVTTTSAIIISGVVYNGEQLIGSVGDKVASIYAIFRENLK